MHRALLDDDILWIKLGSTKPAAGKVIYRAPTEEEAALARGLTRAHAQITSEDEPAEPLFEFETRWDEAATLEVATSGQRIVYPFSLPYGEPFKPNALGVISDQYLHALAGSGVTDIWVQIVLSELYPWELRPGDADEREMKLDGLRALIEQCGRHGIGVFAYLNEPRGVPIEFFRHHPQLRGVDEHPSRPPAGTSVAALCLSAPVVQDFVRDGVAHLLTCAPDLAGILAITFSENLTNCFSREYTENACALWRGNRLLESRAAS